MVYDKFFEGKNINFRDVKSEDAEFILRLRLDENLNKYLNKVSPNIEEQENWINRQRSRENDYYFLILDKKKCPIGTIGIYDIDVEKGTFNWGRWILLPNAPITSLIESTLFAYHFGFKILNLNRAESDVRLGNFKVINYHLSYHALIYKVDELNAYYFFERSQFTDLINKYKGFYKF